MSLRAFGCWGQGAWTPGQLGRGERALHSLGFGAPQVQGDLGQGANNDHPATQTWVPMRRVHNMCRVVWSWVWQAQADLATVCGSRGGCRFHVQTKL